MDRNIWNRAQLVPDPDLRDVVDGHPARRAVAERVTEARLFTVGNERILRGRLLRDSAGERAEIDAALAPLDVSRYYERIDGDTVITVTHPRAPTLPPEWGWNLLAFVLTVLSTLWAGAYLEGAPWDFFLRDPGRLAAGVPFSAALLGILAAHEFGHYVAARRYGLHVTLPFFIPMPILSPIGTLGAVIKMKTPIYTRRMLLDIGAAGPLAGIVVAIPVTVYGLLHSAVVPETAVAGGLQLGEPLLYRALAWFAGPAELPGTEVMLDSVAFAGWIGLFVTALNMLPIGQLDGGHVLYALLGRGQHVIAYVLFGALLVMGWWWPGWYLWAVLLIVLIKIRHPPVLDPRTGLDPRRRAIGWTAVAIFVLCFVPVPFRLM